MSNSQETTRLGRAEVLRALVDLISADRSAPTVIRMFSDLGTLSVSFADSAAQRAWAGPLGLEIDQPRRHASMPVVMNGGFNWNWHGWIVQTDGNDPLPVDELADRRDKLAAELADLDAKIGSAEPRLTQDDHLADYGPNVPTHQACIRIASEAHPNGPATSWIAECAPCGWVSTEEFAWQAAAQLAADNHTNGIEEQPASAAPVAVSPERVAEGRLDAICLSLDAIEADPQSGETDARSEYIANLPELDHDRTAAVESDEAPGTLHLLDGTRIIPSSSGWMWSR